MGLSDSTIREYLDNIASTRPTPGGGAVAAIILSEGIALISKSFAISCRHKKKAGVSDDKLAFALDSLQKKLPAALSSGEEDMLNFEAFLEAYRSKDNQRITEVGNLLTKAPTNLLIYALEVLEVVLPVKSDVSANIFSDYVEGIMAIICACEFSLINIYCNKDNIQDLPKVQSFITDVKDRLGIYKQMMKEMVETYEI